MTKIAFRLSAIAMGLALALVPTISEACVRAESQSGFGSWNIRFVNTCPYPVIVTWTCNGNCSGYGCSTNRITPGKSDNGYCHNGGFGYRYQQWP